MLLVFTTSCGDNSSGSDDTEPDVFSVSNFDFTRGNWQVSGERSAVAGETSGTIAASAIFEEDFSTAGTQAFITGTVGGSTFEMYMLILLGSEQIEIAMADNIDVVLYDFANASFANGTFAVTNRENTARFTILVASETSFQITFETSVDNGSTFNELYSLDFTATTEAFPGLNLDIVSHCDTQQHRRFDFALGNWVVEENEYNGAGFIGTRQGNNSVRSILGGCGILVNRSQASIIADDETDLETSFRLYDRQAEMWKFASLREPSIRLTSMRRHLGDFDATEPAGSFDLISIDGSIQNGRLRYEFPESGIFTEHDETSLNQRQSFVPVFINNYSMPN